MTCSPEDCLAYGVRLLSPKPSRTGSPARRGDAKRTRKGDQIFWLFLRHRSVFSEIHVSACHHLGDQPQTQDLNPSEHKGDGTKCQRDI